MSAIKSINTDINISQLSYTNSSFYNFVLITISAMLEIFTKNTKI